MSLDQGLQDLLGPAFARLNQGFQDLPPSDARFDREGISGVLQMVADRLQDNDPYHHPLYVGQMLKPPHPVARLAYALAQTINPNNHALDGGRASSQMEKEVVEATARMFGWSVHLGHLTSGGTMANFEALWVARELAPGKAIAVSDQAHYTHERLSAVLGVPVVKLPTDEQGRLEPDRVMAALEAQDIGTLVVSLGTTALGAVDALDELLPLARSRGVRVHVDTAYGGYFTLAKELGPQERAAYDALAEVDSIAIDPHKHGLQPYGCGCVLFRDPEVGRFYRHDSPYTYFSSEELHLGEISLECSRAGAAAVALWATWQHLPYDRGGAFGRSLDACLEAARALHAHLESHARCVPLMDPQLDIVVWAVIGESFSASSDLARRVFTRAKKEEGLHLALATLPARFCGRLNHVRADAEEITVLRACVMKPEHRGWMPQLIERLDRALNSLDRP